MQKLVEDFIRTTNGFDIEAALSLFASSPVIDDVSVGDAFKDRDGVRLYLERFFVGYNTASRLLSLRNWTSSAHASASILQAILAMRSAFSRLRSVQKA
jgi:hypothetical protein